MMTAAEFSPEQVRARAHCTADAAGGLTFDVVRPGRDEERWGAGLLLCRRTPGFGGAAEEVRLPLVPTAAGVLRAALPSTMTLTEGVWNAYFTAGDGGRVRLLPGTHDLRSLVDRVPRSGRTWLGVRIPYTTQRGNLALRAWQRWPHVEVADPLVADGALALRGRLYGAELGERARLEVVPRGRRRALATAGARADGVGFLAVLPLAGLRPPPGDGYELWLRPAPDALRIRVARILDDVADKQHRMRHPAVSLADGRHRARLGYTGANDLLLRVEEERPAR
ncbi:hypothetical protein GCM10023347_15650 [Streptomyces chumphonensis]|uniref:Transferase n=1 Tax=Streptomyces chumphonensis TaxID=1214925 RepID=A0A927EZ92_9ACTN|nr:hypothetical protein [Streptomyces chumphonensis]MBD3931477.1 hypothetical protein [Streptomyces chumphonensis]